MHRIRAIICRNMVRCIEADYIATAEQNDRFCDSSIGLEHTEKFYCVTILKLWVRQRRTTARMLNSSKHWKRKEAV
jgi:hypothetical protein